MNKHLIKAHLRIVLVFVISIVSVVFILFPVSKLYKETSILSIPVIAFIVIISTFGYVLSFTKTKTYHVISDWITFFTLSSLSILCIFSFFILPSNVNQSSMFPTLSSNDRILIYHYKYEVELHDIVVIEINIDVYPNIPISSFIDPYETDQKDFVYYVKRVYGMKGDTITFERTSPNSDTYYILINDVKLISSVDVSYTLNFSQMQFLESQLNNHVIEEGYFVLGDNALASLDSRAFGLVREVDMMGKVVFKLWPFGRVS
jgi:signal peptidase I